MDKKLVCVEIRTNERMRVDGVTIELMEVELDDPESLAELAIEIGRRFNVFFARSKTPGMVGTTRNVWVNTKNDAYPNNLLKGLKGVRVLPKINVQIGECRSYVNP